MRKYLTGIALIAGLSSCQQVIDAKLSAAASEFNKNCPMLVDKETRLDNVIAMPGKTLQYNYTLVNYSRAELDTVKLKEALIPEMKQTLQTSPDLKYMRESKVTMLYRYKDKTGAYLMSIQLKPDTK